MKLNIDSLTKHLGFVPKKLQFWTKPASTPFGEPSTSNTQPTIAKVDTSSSILRALGGSTMMIDEYYFPPDVIGGICPHVPGEEEETAWNAAAEACDSERVHIVWQTYNGHLWYLAIRSSELASHPNSWCPFAAVLPGMKEALAPPVCYTFYGEDIASMMTITDDSLHIYRGTNPIVRAKAERTAREIGNAAIIDLTPENILNYEQVPWYSVSLFEQRARRVLAVTAVAVSTTLTILAFMVWIIASVSLVSSRHQLGDAIARTQSKTVDLMNEAQRLRATPVRDELTKFANLNEGLLDLNGFLEIYSISGGKTRWRATVPTNVTADRINALGGKTIDSKPTGTVIGNAAEIEFESAEDKKK